MKNEAKTPLAVSDSDLNTRKKSLKNFLFGWVKDKYDKTFLWILLAAFLIRLWIFWQTKDQALWWDAADYMAAAKRWAGANPHLIDIWYYRRGFLWPLIGTFFFMLNIGEIGMRFLVVLMSTGFVLVTYALISEMFNKKLGLLTSIGVAGSWLFIFFTGRVLTNLPSAFFLLTAVLFFWKGYVKKQGTKYFILFGVFAALATLTRMQDLMFSFPLLFLAIIKEKHKVFVNKKLWLAVAIFFVIMIPQLFVHNAHFGNPLLDLTNYYLGIKGISQTGEVGVELAKFSDLFLYMNNLPYILDGNYLDPSNAGYSNVFIPIHLYPIFLLFIIGFFLLFVDLFLGIDKIFKDEEIQKRAFIFVWIVTTFLFLGYIAPQLEQRYIMQTIPFLFLIAVYPSVFFENLLKNKFKDKAFFIILLIFFILLIPNLIFGKNLMVSKISSYQEIKMAGEWIKANSNPEDIIVGGSLPQLTYYSERSVYPFELAYRREMKKTGEAELEKFIAEKRPRYYSISIIERDEEWTYNFPQKHQDLLIPVQVYQQNNQPVLVIYQFNYNNVTSLNLNTNQVEIPKVNRSNKTGSNNSI